MDPKTRALMFGVIALVVLAALIGSIIYLGNASKNTPSRNINPVSTLPVVSAQPSPTPGEALPATGMKTYAGNGFNLSYPANWGILTCSNTANFEFDPVNNQDLKGIICDTAVKPITVMVYNNLRCSGSPTSIGNYQVFKSSGPLSGGGTQYHWCLSAAGKTFDITERVSSSGNQATSPNDYSAQVEQMIKSISKTPQAS